MTMTKAHMLCILWMIIFFSSSSTVRGAQRDTVPKQQQTTSTKDSSTPGQLVPVSSSGGYRNSTSTSAVSSSTSISISTPSSSSSSSIASGSTPGSGRFLPAETTAPPTEQARVGPYFDVAASKNVTALLGKTAYLNCRVKNLGNKTMLLQVSWVRHRDIHLLTVGRYTYTSDQRFRAIHHPHTEDWSLQIKYPQHRDSGIYECQISTTPHMSHFVHLNVIEPSTEIIGAPDLYIESGSTINLTCVVKDSPEPPAYIFWNHNNAIISYDSPRGGVSVITEKGDTTTSFLLIQNARPSDSGQYTCNPSNAKSKSVTVHVLNGVSHSVSRGVPSSNAARGTTASSHAAQPSALGAGVGACVVLALLHRYAASAGHFRWPVFP
ncbi:hemicentin-2-like [Anopheles ziemanni]|uniref:hemicentin-2-like n=1 Tax=Anopheles ziemanni TaxID=345580 RepID=UPI00265F72C6|nr:hemicentin-2-like [Anopheles ziemanni]